MLEVGAAAQRVAAVHAERLPRDPPGLRAGEAPWRFSDATAAVAGPPAWRGEHNRSVLTGLLGRSDEDVDDLEAAGVLVARPPRG